jgi:F-type H+-transporting ATPase subunit gamma
MTDRLSDIEARIGSVQQLSSVVGAMRGIAAARSREARQQLDGIRSYSQAIASAIGEALALLQGGRATYSVTGSQGRQAVIALCAEQGFAGNFNERVLDAALEVADPAAVQEAELLVIGDRGLMIAGERGLKIAWSMPMIAHVDQAADLTNAMVEALYARLDAGSIEQVTIIHAAPGHVEDFQVLTRRLVPFDYQRFAIAPGTAAPLITLPGEVLVQRLAEEYIFAELFEAVILSFAAENEARTRAMIAARTNVSKTLDELVARSRQLRQEEITNEIVELASGAQSADRNEHRST